MNPGDSIVITDIVPHLPTGVVVSVHPTTVDVEVDPDGVVRNFPVASVVVLGGRSYVIKARDDHFLYKIKARVTSSGDRVLDVQCFDLIKGGGHDLQSRKRPTVFVNGRVVK